MYLSLSIRPSVSPSVHPSIHPSACLPACNACIYLYVCVYIYTVYIYEWINRHTTAYVDDIQMNGLLEKERYDYDKPSTPALQKDFARPCVAALLFPES